MSFLESCVSFFGAIVSNKKQLESKGARNQGQVETLQGITLTEKVYMYLFQYLENTEV